MDNSFCTSHTISFVSTNTDIVNDISFNDNSGIEFKLKNDILAQYKLNAVIDINYNDDNIIGLNQIFII